MTREAIARLGTQLGPDVLGAVRAVYDREQAVLAAAISPGAVDCAYGPHPRQRLDLYGDAGAAPKPVVLFVHGGGFVLGDKGSADRWENAAVGRWAAHSGMIGAVMNYRLAPDHVWPAGSEDVGLAVDWLRANAAAHGGDHERIFVMGTSAGSVHIAGLLRLRPDVPVRGVVMLSGLYGYTPLDPRDERYYGAQTDFPAKSPLEAAAASTLPIFLACAEFDPPRFQAEFVGLMQDRLHRHGALPRAYIASGHNHYSMAMHIGTSDCRLSDEIAGFIRDHG